MASSYSFHQKIFRDAINHHHPDEYPQLIEQAIDPNVVLGPGPQYRFELLRSRTLRSLALVFFESPCAQFIGSLTHKNPAAPGLSRDERMLAWFQSCEQAGAEFSQTLAWYYDNRHDFFEALGPLIKSGSSKTLAWWRSRGLDRVPLPLAGHGVSLPTLALYHGQVDMAQQLLCQGGEEAVIDCPHILWKRVRHRDNLRHCDKMAQMLLKSSSPPPDFLLDFPFYAINQKNAGAAAKMFRCLLQSPHCLLSKDQATLALSRLVDKLRSPAAIELVQVLLDHGADPIGDPPSGPLAHALDGLARISFTDILQQVRRDCVILLLEKTTPSQSRQVLTSELLDELSSRLNSQNRSFNEMLRANARLNKQANLALLRKISLRQRVHTTPTSLPAPSSRTPKF